MAYHGSCLCGAIEYTIERTRLNAMHCYCAMCRKAHGTAFSTHCIVPPQQLHWTLQHTQRVAYQSSHSGWREFCPHCGTHLLVHGQSGDGNLAVPAGTLDGNPGLNILGHMYTSERVSWFPITDALPQYDTWPPGFGQSSDPPQD
ncbi:MAG: GFA family protein [Pseudomonadota bacterium]